MKAHVHISVAIFLGLGFLATAMTSAQAPPPTATSRVSVSAPAQIRTETKLPAQRMLNSYGGLPLSFEINRGQTDAQVKFLARGPGYTMFLTRDGAVLSLRSEKPEARRRKGIGHGPVDRGTRIPDRTQSATDVIRLRLAGANPDAEAVGASELPGRANYFIGNDPQNWRTNIPTFARVIYKNAYPGIDLVYYGNQGQLEYDFVVHPGANPNAIRLALGTGLPGQDEKVGVKAPLQVRSNGDLVMRAPSGEIRFLKPVVYQPGPTLARGKIPGVVGDRSFGSKLEHAQRASGRFVLLANNEIGFTISGYDKTRPLVIDPVLVYSTYVSDGGIEVGSLGIAVDASGDAYITGGTPSSAFPTTSGAYQQTLKGAINAFVTKLNPQGTGLVYSTFIGGSDNDIGSSLALDSSGNAYVTGNTDSPDFPTVKPFQSSCEGCSLSVGETNAFVLKLNPTGSALSYSTFLGNAETSGLSIALDSSGDAYVVGNAGQVSGNFPLVNPLSSAGGAFLCEFNPAGSSLVYSTLLGADVEMIPGGGVAVDASGNAYVVGTSSDAIVDQAFVTAVNAGGSAFLYSKTLGATTPCTGCIEPSTNGTAIAVDSSGSAYFTGYTNASGYPTTAKAFSAGCGSDGGCNGGAFFNAVVTKLDHSGSIVYSTYLGVSQDPSGDDVGTMGAGIGVDLSGDAYVTGWTQDVADFPVVNAVSGTCPSCSSLQPPAQTAFVTEVNPTGTALVYSTLLGAGGEEGNGIAVGTSGAVYIVGDTTTTNFPTTSGAYNATGTGNPEAFVAEIGSAESGVSLSPSSLVFSSQTEGTTSAAQTATLANFTSSSLTISNISITGSDSADFSMPTAGTTCSTSSPVAASGGNCTIAVEFKPSIAGSESATLNVADGAGTQTVSLSGTGAAASAPVAGLSPASLTFASQSVGSTSTAQTVTVSNTGTANLTFNSISVTGTNPSDFAVASSGTTCSTSLPVAPGANCTIAMTFAPAATGSRSATLSIADNASDSPQAVSLSGTGAPPGAAPIVAQVALPSDAQVLALNAQINRLYVSGGTQSSPQTYVIDTSQSSYPTLTSVYGQYPDVDLKTNRFWTAGVYDGDAFAYDGGTNSQVTSVSVGDCPVGVNVDSLNRLVYVIAQCGSDNDPVFAVNADTYAVTGSLHSGGVNGAPGAVDTSTAVLFWNPSSGPKEGDFLASTPAMYSVPDAPVAGVNSTTNTGYGINGQTLYVFNLANKTSPTVSHTVSLAGSVTAGIVGVNATRNHFYVYESSGSPAAGELEIFDGNSNAVLASLNLGANIQLQSGAVDSTQNLVYALGLNTATSGRTLYVVQDNAGVILSPSSLSFGNQGVGMTSAPLTLTVANNTLSPLTISKISIAGANAADFAVSPSGTTCSTTSTVAANSSCAINVTFTPAATGSRVGTLSITGESNGAVATIPSVNLSGTGLTVPTVTVNPGASSITTTQALAVAVTVSGVSGAPTPTGSVTLSSGSYTSAAATLTSGAATFNVPAGALAVGNDTLTATYSGDSTYSTATGTGSITVNAAPGFSLSASPASVSVAQGGSGTSTITVTDVGGFSGTVTLAATGLPSGVAAAFAAGTAAGTQIVTLTANPSAAVTSNPVTVTIAGSSGTLTATTSIALTITAQPGFTAGSGGTTSLTNTPGETSTGTISVVGTNGFSGTVTLSCNVTTSIANANDMPTCSLSPTSVTLSGTTAQTSTLTVTTTAASSARNQMKRLIWPSAGGTVLALVLLFAAPRRRRDWLTIMGLLLLLVSIGSAGCGIGGSGGGGGGGGGNSGTTAGTYTVTVTGTSGAISATVGTVSLTVQ